LIHDAAAIVPIISFIARALEAIGPDQITHQMLQIGDPYFYAIEGHKIRLLPWPNNRVRINITYYSKGDPLVNPEDYNETLFNLPSVYLYAMLRQAAIWYGDADGQSRWEQALDGSYHYSQHAGL
jgi:hypothetical protein